jgi:hypothetical protein
MKYFENFPSIKYGNTAVTNISARVKFLETAKKQNVLFYPYTIKDGERAENLAFDYYDSTDFVWLVYLINDIVDPYYDWPLSSKNLDKFIAQKYETSAGINDGIAAALGTTVFYQKVPKVYYINQVNLNFYTETEYLATSISDPWNWKKVTQDDSIYVSPDSLTAAMDADPGSQWTALDAYTYETNLNDAKKFIRLLDKTYTTEVSYELKELLSNG